MEKRTEELEKVGKRFTQRFFQVNFLDSYARSEVLHGEVELRHMAQTQACRGDSVAIVEVEFEVYQCPRQPWFVISGDNRLSPRLLTREISCRVIKSGKVGNKNIIKWQA